MSPRGQEYAVFLSYPLGEETPAYGNGQGLRLTADKCIARGDSCNSSRFEMPCHLGTHVDAPLHFVRDGRPVDAFTPQDLLFDRVQVVDIPMAQGRLLRAADLEAAAAGQEIRGETQALLIRTGFGVWRGEQSYVLDGPGFSDEAAKTLLSLWPGVRAVGMDFISVNRYSERPEGRAAHVTLLSRDRMLLIEDMDLTPLPEGGAPARMFVAPLRLQGADGAPCTVLAWLS